MEKDVMKDSSGASLGVTFVILGVIVQFVFVEYNLAIWIATFLIGLGISGLGMEMDKVNPVAGYGNFGIGFSGVMFGVLLLNYFDSVGIKILAMFVLLFGFYALITGSFAAFIYEKESKDNKDNELDDSQNEVKLYVVKFIKIVVGIVGFLSNLSTVIINFGD